jgi:wyosine [tRNA(Phe)-imidazoG37] synthetase (radical SAM superfamily)
MNIYGPVPSRRFGLSLGVDLVTPKTCPYDCPYCQLGPTSRLSVTPEEFYPLDTVLKEVEAALADGPKPDVITLAGSGEPTLFKPLRAFLEGVRSLSDTPILLITNGSLLWREEVAEAAMIADIIAPSLDAGDEGVARRVNRPHPDISYSRMFEGLKKVTHAHPGAVQLEVMLVKGINDDPESLNALVEQINALRFDRIDINTPVRPPVPERGALPCDRAVLERAAALFGPRATAIGAFKKRKQGSRHPGRAFSDRDKDIRALLMRRPCTADDIAAALGLSSAEVGESLGRLDQAGLVEQRPGIGEPYFHAPNPGPGLSRKLPDDIPG